MSELQAIPPTLSSQVLLSKDQREKQGVGQAYADTYNSALAIDNDRAYQEYLYNKYSSPAAYMKQLEDAGLNTAFAAGGQPSNSPNQSSNNFKSSIAESNQKALENKLSTVNTILNGIAQGVNITSNIMSIPKDQALKTYQNVFAHYRNILSGIDITTKGYKADSAHAKSIADLIYYLGASNPDWNYTENGITYDPQNSMFVNQQELRNSLMDIKNRTANWDLDNLKPAQLTQLNEMIDNISGRTSFLGLQQDMYSALKSAGLLTPIVVALIKGLL